MLSSRLRASLEEQIREQVEAETAARAEADFQHTREHLYAYLSKSARTEAEHALTEQRREVQAEALHLAARDAAIRTRENSWTRHRNRGVALGAIPRRGPHHDHPSGAVAPRFGAASVADHVDAHPGLSSPRPSDA